MYAKTLKSSIFFCTEYILVTRDFAGRLQHLMNVRVKNIAFRAQNVRNVEGTIPSIVEILVTLSVLCKKSTLFFTNFS